MALASIEINEKLFLNKNVDYRVLAALAAYSWYDRASDRRKIRKEKTKYPFMSEVTKDLSRYRYNKTMEYLKNIGYLTVDEDDEMYYTMKGKAEYPFFAIENTAFREILTYLDNDCLKLFMWLTSKYSHVKYYNNSRMVFSYKKILNEVYGTKYCTKNIDRAKRCLETIVDLGLAKVTDPWYYEGAKCMLLTSMKERVDEGTKRCDDQFSSIRENQEILGELGCGTEQEHV